MRNLVEPPLSLHCELCDGELRFKWIESADCVFDTEVEIFVCVKCGRAHSRRMTSRPLRRAHREEHAARSRRTSRAEPAAIDTLDARSRIRLTSLRTRRNGVGGRVHGAARRRRTPPITTRGRHRRRRRAGPTRSAAAVPLTVIAGTVGLTHSWPSGLGVLAAGAIMSGAAGDFPNIAGYRPKTRRPIATHVATGRC